MVLGVGPFTIESVSKFGNTNKKLLLTLYPLTMIAGIWISFKELTSTIVSVLMSNYYRKGKKIEEGIFTTLE